MMESEQHRTDTLDDFLKDTPGVPAELAGIVGRISAATIEIARILRQGRLTGLTEHEGTTNVHGDSVKKIDIFADRQLISSLEGTAAGLVITEENDNPVEINGSSLSYIVYFDPLDGSSNTGVNVTTGTIFSIYRRISSTEKEFSSSDILQRGIHQAAAGYVLYGPATELILTTGSGVYPFVLDERKGEFICASGRVTIPGHGTFFSVDEGRYEGWEQGVKAYVYYCKQGHPESGRPYTGRYVGSMVADVHRTLLEGGIFLFPSTETLPNGKLRLMYECNPLAFVIEQAGGMAVDGERRILELHPGSVHQRTPVYIGSSENVKEACSFLSRK